MNGHGTSGRRTFLALGAAAVLAGCLGGSGAGSDGGNSSNSTTIQNHESTPSSSGPTTISDRTPTSSQPATASSTTTSGESTGETEQPHTDDESVDIDSNDTFPQTTVGVAEGSPSTGGSATILVWNDAETARRIRASIATRNAGTSVLSRTYRIEADAYIEIGMTKPGAYSLDVGLDGDELTTIDFHIDTCNGERITVAIREDGTVNWERLSTAMGCSTVTETE